MQGMLRVVAERLQTEPQFVDAIVTDPAAALAPYGLTNAQERAVAAFVARYQQYGLSGLDGTQQARWWSPEEPAEQQARWWSPEEPAEQQARWWSPEDPAR